MAQHDIDLQGYTYDTHPVAAATSIAEGAYVSASSGAPLYARNLNVADVFLGVGLRARDNSTGAAGDKDDLPVLVDGVLRNKTVTGVTTSTPIGTKVYATSSTALQTDSSGGLLVGRVVKVNGTNDADVRFQGAGYRDAV